MTSMFMFAHNLGEDDSFSAEELKHFFNARPEVKNWVKVLADVYILTVSLDTGAFNTIFREYIVKNGRSADAYGVPQYCIFKLESSGKGILPKGAWSIIRSMRLEVQ